MIMRGKYLLAGIVASTLLLGACDLNIHLPGGNNDSSEDKQKTEKSDNNNKTPNSSNKNNNTNNEKNIDSSDTQQNDNDENTNYNQTEDIQPNDNNSIQSSEQNTQNQSENGINGNNETTTNESHSTSDNQSNDSSNKELTPQQAEDVVYDWYKNQGFGHRLRNEFNYNPSKSTDDMYYIDYAASDAYGTGTPYVAIVDKHTGSIVDNYNNMTDEEKAKRKQMNESKLE